jgi:hypothetical protein
MLFLGEDGSPIKNFWVSPILRRGKVRRTNHVNIGRLAENFLSPNCHPNNQKAPHPMRKATRRMHYRGWPTNENKIIL